MAVHFLRGSPRQVEPPGEGEVEARQRSPDSQGAGRMVAEVAQQRKLVDVAEGVAVVAPHLRGVGGEEPRAARDSGAAPSL